MGGGTKIRSVAVIGAGAAGAITAAALQAEEAFDLIKIFERRDRPGGTWIYDEAVQPDILVRPGAHPRELDPPLRIPHSLPRVTPPNKQERFSKTPIYPSLTTNVPDLAMCYSDSRFAYGPFVPHHVARQYVENYFAIHRTDASLVLNTTVEDLSRVSTHPASIDSSQWKLTLRKHDALRDVDEWWSETFDAVVLANGHFSVPHIPHVDGLDEYIRRFPRRITHSKTYRTPDSLAGKRVIIVGNSASGHDIVRAVATTARLPVYQSIRTKSVWDPAVPPDGIEYKPVIARYSPTGSIIFADGSSLDDVDAVIYCTGYSPSFPFWNAGNGRPLWDYDQGRLAGNYLHTFLRDFPTLGVVGIVRGLTFRSFEYQAVALARVFAGRNVPLPSPEEQAAWESTRADEFKKRHRAFHDVLWENGETHEWLGALFDIAGLCTLTGLGRIPPRLDREITDVIDHPIKRPEPYGCGSEQAGDASLKGQQHRVEGRKDSRLGFI